MRESENERLAIRYVRSVNDQAIATDVDKAAWLEARRYCVSATDVNRLVRPDGQRSAQWNSLLVDKITNAPPLRLKVFERGITREPIIADWVSSAYPEENFSHNTKLVHGKNERHVATPDMIGDGALCEIKVSVDALSKVKARYRNQMQWQMHVTDSDYVLLVVEDRYSTSIDTHWEVRDDTRIAALQQVANQFLVELDAT